jgi:hypothetical protein
MIWEVKDKPKSKSKSSPLPKSGDIKFTKRFSWLPKRIGKYYYWLEPYYDKYEWKLKKHKYSNNVMENLHSEHLYGEKYIYQWVKIATVRHK